MLKEVMPYRLVMTTWITKELGAQYIDDNDWDTASMMLEFLEVFYLATTASLIFTFLQVTLLYIIFTK